MVWYMLFVQTHQVEALKQEVDQIVRMAELIEYNLEDVDNVILAVRSILASGMDWKDLARMIKEKKRVEILWLDLSTTFILTKIRSPYF